MLSSRPIALYGGALWVLLSLTFIVGCMEAKHDPGSEKISTGFGKLEASFESLNKKIFAAKCVECHSGSNTPHGIDLSTYEKIMSGNVFPPLVIPGDPMGSSLYTSVLNNSMPKDRQPLSPFEKQVLFDWIKKGALKVPGGGDGKDPCEGDDCDDDEPCDNDEPCCDNDEPCDGDVDDENDNDDCEEGEPCEDKDNLEEGEPR